MIVCAVLDIGAGTNFVLRGYLPSTDVHFSSRLKTTISEANDRPLDIVGTAALYIRFE